MKSFLRSIQIERLLLFEGGSETFRKTEKYLAAQEIGWEPIASAAGLKGRPDCIAILPLGVDTIPEVLQTFEALRIGNLGLPRIVIATDLHLSPDFLGAIRKLPVAGIVDLAAGGRFTRFPEPGKLQPETFTDAYRSLLLLLDGYLKGNLSLLFHHNTICDTVVNTSPIALCVTDPGGRIIFFNMSEEYLRKYAVSLESVYGKRVYDFTREPEKLHELYEKVLRGDAAEKSELLVTYGEHDFSFSVTARKLALYDTDAVLLTGINVTRQRQTEGLLHETEEKYRFLVENSSEGICLVSRDRILYANPRFNRIFAIPENESAGGMSALELVQGDDAAVLQGILAREPEKLPATVELAGLRKNGGRIDIELTISAFSMKNERFLQVIVRDITETKKIWQNILQYERLSAIGELVSGISHEFNNIITSIRGYIQYSLTGSQDRAAMNETLRTIDSLTEHGANIIRKLGMLSRQEITNREACSLVDLTEGILSIQERILLQEGITLHRQYHADPAVFVDRALMHQVLLNLIVNATHAIRPLGKGSITITIDQDDSNAVIAVHDTGTGIDPSIGESIFLPFFTTKKDRNNDVLGTGMGLPISKNIVEQHGGSISFKSSPEYGTEFTVVLPRHSSGAAAGHDIAPADTLREPDASRMAALIADDNTGVRDLLRTILTTIGLRTVDCATNGEEAVRMAQAARYDIIFLDVSMPVLSGIDAFKIIRERNPAQRVVFVTGLFQEKQIQDQVRDRSAYGYITKPFDIIEIRKIITGIACKEQ